MNHGFYGSTPYFISDGQTLIICNHNKLQIAGTIYGDPKMGVG